MESGAGVAVGVAPTSGPAAAGRNIVGHAADEGGVILAGWFRKKAEKRGRTRTRYFVLRAGEFFISYYADYSEHKGPTGLKGEIPIHPRRTNTEVLGRVLLIQNTDRLYDLEAVTGPMQAALWDQVLSKLAASLDVGWFVKAAENIGKSHERFFVIHDNWIEYFSKSGPDGRGKGSLGTIPIHGNTIALPHDSTLFIYGINRTWELTAVAESEANRWATMIQERARRLRHGKSETSKSGEPATAQDTSNVEELERQYTERHKRARDELTSLKGAPKPAEEYTNNDLNAELPPVPAATPSQRAAPSDQKPRPDLYTSVAAGLIDFDAFEDDEDRATVLVYDDMSEIVASEMDDIVMAEDLAAEALAKSEEACAGGADDSADVAPTVSAAVSAAPEEPTAPSADSDKPAYVPLLPPTGGDPYATSEPVNEMYVLTDEDLLELAKAGDTTLPPVASADEPERSASSADVPEVDLDWGTWEIDRESIELKSICGAGEFGEVWAGRLVGSGETAGLVAKIAAKSLKPGTSDVEKREEFLLEARFMMQVHHANIVNLYGVCTVGEPVLIVSEFCDHGNLHNHLVRTAAKSTSRFKIRCLVRFMRECCAAMEYLEDNDFIHRDLAARNVLLDQRLTCKITDFGFAKDVHGLPNKAWVGEKLARIPVRWCAPEALKFSTFSSKSDVWAFGILMYEMVTHCSVELYQGLSNKQVCKAVIKLGFVMAKPAGCPTDIYKIMVQCWQKDPKDRPSFSEIVALLEQLSSTR